MGWSLKFYEFVEINKKINYCLKLDKEIRFFMGPMSKENPYPSKDLILHILNNDEEERIIINPREKVNIKSKFLTGKDIDKLTDFLNIYGMSILDYQLRNMNYLDLKKILDDYVNN